MKKIVGVLLLVFLLGTGVCFAESEIPNLVGTWEVKSEAGFITKGVKQETGRTIGKKSALLPQNSL